MSSKEKDDRCILLKNIASLILLTILLIFIAGVMDSPDTYAERKTLQCINLDENSKGVSRAVYLANKDNSSVKLIKNETNIDNINRNINGFAITIDNNIYGYVLNEEEKDDIIKNICESYVREIGVNTEDISSMKISGKIKATPYKMKISQLSNSNKISKEIYEAAIINKELLNLSISLMTSEKETIEPPVVIENDDSMYIGEEIIVKGEEGLKDVDKEIIYQGLTKVEEKVIDENILINPVATVVHKGSKNPYYDEVEFLTRPLNGGFISSYYGENRITSYHKGLDIANNLGEDVMASFDGKVIFSAYNDGGYGNLVIIQHSNDMKTYYAHLNEIYVSNNQEVKQGDVIGTVGSTGYSTGPHLHFELRINESPVNPLSYIKK